MSEQLHAIDIASYQANNAAQLIAAYNPDHVIVRMYLPWERQGYQDISREQVRIAREMGKSIGVYVWPYAEASAWDTLVETIKLCNSMSPPVIAPVVWLDCEDSVYGPGPNATWLDAWVNACRELQTPTGWYLRVSWIDSNFHGGQEAFARFNAHPIWVADYDGVADLTVFTHGLPMGWSRAAAKQWGVTRSPVGNCDRDVIRPEYTVVQQPDPVDPCAALRGKLQIIHDTKPYRAITKRKLGELLAS